MTGWVERAFNAIPDTRQRGPFEAEAIGRMESHIHDLRCRDEEIAFTGSGRIEHVTVQVLSVRQRTVRNVWRE